MPSISKNNASAAINEDIKTISTFIKEEYQTEAPASAKRILNYLTYPERYTSESTGFSRKTFKLRNDLHDLASFIVPENMPKLPPHTRNLVEALNAVFALRLQPAKQRVETNPKFEKLDKTGQIALYMKDLEVNALAGALLILNRLIAPSLRMKEANFPRHGYSDEDDIDEVRDGIHASKKDPEGKMLVGSGLLKSILDFDPSQKTKLSSYITWGARGAYSNLRKSRSQSTKIGAGYYLTPKETELLTVPPIADYEEREISEKTMEILERVGNTLRQEGTPNSEEIVAFIKAQQENYINPQSTSALKALSSKARATLNGFWLEHPELYVEMQKNGLPTPKMPPRLMERHDKKAEKNGELTWAEKVEQAEAGPKGGRV